MSRLSGDELITEETRSSIVISTIKKGDLELLEKLLEHYHAGNVSADLKNTWVNEVIKKSHLKILNTMFIFALKDHHCGVETLDKIIKTGFDIRSFDKKG